MLTLIIGAAGSGKSDFAETLVCSLGSSRVYLATMQASDPESLARITKHRDHRKGLGFTTVERGLDLAGINLPDNSNLLLEDLSNLLANEMFHPDGGGIIAVQRGLRILEESCRHVTVVTNDLFSGGSDYAHETLAYMRELAMLNRELAARADLVLEICCGIPNILKGVLP